MKMEIMTIRTIIDFARKVEIEQELEFFGNATTSVKNYDGKVAFSKNSCA